MDQGYDLSARQKRAEPAASARPSASLHPSLHQRILEDIQSKILDGRWPPGTAIATEQALAIQYGCSRMTVSKAMNQLATAGMIERRRKAGSFVRRPQSYSAVLEIVDIRREVEQLGLAYGFAVTRSEIRQSSVLEQADLGLGAPVSLRALTCRHFAAGAPFCLEERIINLTVVPEAGDAAFSTMPPGTWLITQVPWTSAEHRIRAIAADTATAQGLALVEGSPCLQIERRTWSAGRPVTVVRLTYPGDGLGLVAHFTPTQPS